MSFNVSALGVAGPIHRLARLAAFRSKESSSAQLRPSNAAMATTKSRYLMVRMQASDSSSSSSSAGATTDEKWMELLPDKKSALYCHSLPCIEAWLRSLGFEQRDDDRAAWLIKRPDWHAQLYLEATELRIRYLRSGPGNLERDIERKFSYALSRQDLENAILAGP